MSLNPLAIRFVKNLAAAFCRWKVSTDTIDLYSEKLSKWHLQPDQWSRALSKIVADLPDAEFPTLSVIYGYLRSAQLTGPGESDKGWLCYEFKGKKYSVRVKNAGDKWVFAAMSYTDKSNQIVQLQKHPGDEATYPDGATGVHVMPDKLYDESGKCTAEEGSEAFTRGYLEAGGDPSRLEEMMRALRTQIPEEKTA